ncbi:hypothetical protein H8356DRAFT_1744504 [Neocallimastix lanati (nom. inval.)]|jgi:hypothetical protein|nr:hypothetical protein H8356DRAFT_1744504 [Neocallimastix sp. JGI-2020a]
MTPLPKQSLIPMHLNKDALKHIKKSSNCVRYNGKLKEIYNRSENTGVQLLMDKLYYLKTKSIYDCMVVISEIKKKNI